MSYLNDPNWWAFAIEPDLRTGTTVKLLGDMDINPVLANRFQLLDYHTYIGLDKLLDCQVPSSVIPDERIFIITHQMFELAFKMMIFDCAVIAKTFQLLLTKDKDVLTALCLASASDNSAEEFWRPAVTASGRLKFFSGKVLRRLMTLLAPADGTGEDAVELFNPKEFKIFRDNLIPASGFQTAQFRLIQRALGKSSLLEVPLFPSHKFQKHYLGENTVDGLPVSLIDQLVLRSGYILANPAESSTPASVAQLDDLAHEILGRVQVTDVSFDTPPISLDDDQTTINDLGAKYKKLLEELQEKEGDTNWRIEEAVHIFQESWTKAIARENDRRRSLNNARRAAWLVTQYPHDSSYIAKILKRIIDTDRNLHGHRDAQGRIVGGFLSAHRHTAGKQILDDPNAHGGGTSGGGIPYLRFSIDELFGLFPALVAYADLREASRAQPRTGVSDSSPTQHPGA